MTAEEKLAEIKVWVDFADNSLKGDPNSYLTGPVSIESLIIRIRKILDE